MRASVTASFVALLCLAIRGLQFPEPTAGMSWHTIPGFVFGIPAVPWIMPVMFGIALLRRAGTETWIGRESSNSGAVAPRMPG